MNKINIALLAGGDSSEREVSLGSAQQVFSSLDKNKYNVFLIDVKGLQWMYTDENGDNTAVDLNDFSLPLASGMVRLEYALIMIHGTPGEDGKMQGYFDMAGIPYSTCDLVSTVLTFDKTLCKKVVAQAGVNVAKEVMVRKGDSVDAGAIVAELGLPLFVKPNASGSSFGVTKVKTKEELLPALGSAFEESDLAMAEEFVDGMEIACGLIINDQTEKVLPLTEIVSKKEFFDYQAKYTPGYSDEITPARIEGSLAEEISQMAVKAYRAAGCRGLVRIDFIVDRRNTPVMIEINSVPGMSSGSIIPKQAIEAGTSLAKLFDMVIADTYFERR